MINAPNAIRKDLAGAPISVGKFLAYSASNSDHGISSAIFTQRLRSDNFPHEGSSKSEGDGVASSAFLYTIAGGDARVLTYFTCLSCTLFSVARSKPRLRQVRSIYSASPTYLAKNDFSNIPCFRYLITKYSGSLELTVIFLPNQKSKLIRALENCLALEKPYPCRIINLIRLWIPSMTPLVVRLTK